MATTIHVGNLSFSTGEEDLKSFFSKYGKVTDAYIVKRFGRPRGYGFVEFDSSSAADNALSANGESLDERNINIEKAKGKIVKSNFNDNNNDNNNSGGGQRRYNNNRGGGYRNNNYGGDRNNYGYGGQRNNYGDGGQRSYGNYGDGGQRNYGGGGYRNNNYGGDRNNYGDGGQRNYGGDREQRNYGSGGGGYNRSYGRQYRDDDDRGQRRTFTLRNDNRNNQGGPRRRNFQIKSDADKDKSTSTIYVSNLPFSVDDVQLAKIFNKYQVKTSHVVQSMSGRSRGYGFVEFETNDDQTKALQEMENFEVKGSDDRVRNITCKVALVERPRESSGDDNNNDNTDTN
jgi:RNA recognition motif-containing protein